MATSEPAAVTGRWPSARLWGRPDPSVSELGREGEVLVAKVRAGMAVAAVCTVLLAPPPEAGIFLAGYSTMLLVAVAVLLLARRPVPVPGLGLFSCLFDVSLVTLIHAGLVVAGNPLLATNSRAVFNVYFLVLSLTCLRLDPRLCVAAGVTAVLQYGGIVLWAVDGGAQESSAASASGAFRWDNQIARLLLLGIATAVDVALVRLGRKYWTASIHDRLTGLHNRGYAESRLGEAMAAARRTGRTVAVALADLDHFKEVNDRLGHAAGDEVLRHTGGLLRRSFRASDVVARYGGEEFLIVFPEIDRQAALDRIDRFRASFAAAAAPVPVALTLSIGLAAYPGDGETAAELLGRADERLYAAKQAGRDRIRGWTGET